MFETYWISALANHLWQSTGLAAVAWLLAYALRKNQARTRYWIWMIASLKFVLPFSLLIEAGKRMGSMVDAPIARPTLSSAIEQITQPFPQTSSTVFAAPTIAAHNGNLLPLALLSLWAIGALTIAFSWTRRWLQIRAAVRAASPRAIDASIPVMSSSSLLEPGVFGIVQPVLLLPDCIAGRLTEAQLHAIVAHEMCHVQRRDNLTFALHMTVETLFWFHPLVWWIRVRLIEERERACDEAVLQSGSEAEVYAEGILNVCKFYVGSPLACVSGVTGSDLKKRIIRIMTERVVKKLEFRKKLLLSLTGLAAVSLPVVFGLTHTTAIRAQSAVDDSTSSLPSFDVVSIKLNTSDSNMFMSRFEPDGIHATNAPLMMIVRQAYGLFTSNDDQIVGAPAWFKTDRYDIEAKVSEADLPRFAKLNVVQRNAMLQPLLADRFKLVAHRETRELPIYSLVIARSGPKLKESTPGVADPNGVKDERGRSAPTLRFGIGQIDGQAVPMGSLLGVLTQITGRTVVDRTGLAGKYDITLRWTPDELGVAPPSGSDAGKTSPRDTGPSIFTALREQLGLELDSTKGPVEGLVIDHVEKPSAN